VSCLLNYFYVGPIPILVAVFVTMVLIWDLNPDANCSAVYLMVCKTNYIKNSSYVAALGTVCFLHHVTFLICGWAEVLSSRRGWSVSETARLTELLIFSRYSNRRLSLRYGLVDRNFRNLHTSNMLILTLRMSGLARGVNQRDHPCRAANLSSTMLTNYLQIPTFQLFRTSNHPRCRSQMEQGRVGEMTW